MTKPCQRGQTVLSRLSRFDFLVQPGAGEGPIPPGAVRSEMPSSSAACSKVMPTKYFSFTNSDFWGSSAANFSNGQFTVSAFSSLSTTAEVISGISTRRFFMPIVCLIGLHPIKLHHTSCAEGLRIGLGGGRLPIRRGQALCLFERAGAAPGKTQRLIGIAHDAQ